MRKKKGTTMIIVVMHKAVVISELDENTENLTKAWWDFLDFFHTKINVRKSNIGGIADISICVEGLEKLARGLGSTDNKFTVEEATRS